MLDANSKAQMEKLEEHLHSSPPKLAGTSLGQKSQSAPLPTLHPKTTRYECHIIRKPGDVIVFQLTGITKEFESTLERLVEDHFGTTDGFSVHYEPGIHTFGLRADNLVGRPGMTVGHIVKFAHVVDAALEN